VAGSVTGVIRWVVPIMLTVFLLALLVREKPLRTTSALGGPATQRQPAPAPSGAQPAVD